MVALLGRQDQPTDALRDYCRKLAEALCRRGVTLELVEARWEKDGWLRALRELWRKGPAWKGDWVLLQYTGLMWSRRGFPLRALLVLAVLKLRGCRVAGVFHDIRSPRPRGWLQRFRLSLQYRVMRAIYRWADRSIVTVPLEGVPWLPERRQKAAFVPVGPNVPARDEIFPDGVPAAPKRPKTVAVFSFSAGPNIGREAEAIAGAVKRAAAVIPDLRLRILGRGSKEVEPFLRQALSGTQVELDARGLLEPEEVTRLLAECDVQLYVRAPLSSRRGSTLAGIACGLPVVAYRGAETGFPITEAGVVLVPEEDEKALGEALTEVLVQDELRARLSAKSLEAHRSWFSWDRVAHGVLQALGGRIPETHP